jgi:hypothetical protein
MIGCIDHIDSFTGRRRFAWRYLKSTGTPFLLTEKEEEEEGKNLSRI